MQSHRTTRELAIYRSLYLETEHRGEWPLSISPQPPPPRSTSEILEAIDQELQWVEIGSFLTGALLHACCSCGERFLVRDDPSPPPVFLQCPLPGVHMQLLRLEKRRVAAVYAPRVYITARCPAITAPAHKSLHKLCCLRIS